MSLRYQRKSRFDERSGVVTFEGLDPVTGLPVLIYEFEGEVNPNLESLESENIPGILALGSEDGLSQAVVAYSKGYLPLGQPLRVTLETLLLDSARALRDAAAADVIHGDINAERFWGSSEHVLIEGFGIPWRTADKPSLQGDIKDWAGAVRTVLGEVPAALSAILSRCEGTPDTRPSAEKLFNELSALDFSQLLTATAKKTLHDIDIGFSLNDMHGASSATPVPTEFDTELDFVVTDTPAPQAVATPPDRVKSSSVVMGLPPGAQAREAQGLSDPKKDMFGQPKGGLRSTPQSSREAEQTRANKQTFIKNLPPGATYHAGSTEEPAHAPRPQGHSKTPFEETFSVPKQVRAGPPWGILAAVFLAAIALVFGAFIWQGRSGVTFTGSSADVNYLVEMVIGPGNIPPVELLVVQSPEGSRHAVGSLLVSRYPAGTHQLVLDREGAWQLQARIRGVYPEDVSSDIVAVTLPQERNISFTLPIPSSEPLEPEDPQ